MTAELAIVSEHVRRYRERVAEMAMPLRGGAHDDAVAVMFEAERTLRIAQRHLDRAVSLLES